MVHKFFDTKYGKTSRNAVTSAAQTGTKIDSDTVSKNKQFAKKLQKLIIRQFKKRKVYSSFKDKFWGDHHANVQLISKHNKDIRLVFRVNNVFSKYLWVLPLKNKKVITITDAFPNILDEFARKTKKNMGR